MKKSVSLIILLLSVTISSANVQQVCDYVPLQVGIIDPTSTENPYPKTPILVPTVDLDGYTLTFDTSCLGNTVQIVQDEIVVYSEVVTSVLQIALPFSLSGEYKLQIIRGNFCFYGYIYL